MATRTRRPYARQKVTVTMPLASGEQKGVDPQLTDGAIITAADVLVNQQGRHDKRTGLTTKTGTFADEDAIAATPGGLEKTRLAVIPLGTVNVFAKDINLPSNAEDAWRVIRKLMKS